MIEEDRGCADILMQISAINKAPRKCRKLHTRESYKKIVTREIKLGNNEIVAENGTI